MTTHLVAVWNPSYEADALQLHLEVLLRAAREFRAGTREEDDVFVWWGKVRSSNRQQPLAHLPEVLALDDLIDSGDDTPEVHLYLTDYRSLYVAHLGAVTAEDRGGEPETPAYYRERGLNCDCWFQLWDVRRLVQDDTPAVTHELAKLRNVRYHGRPVSLYGGMVELPLLVTRPDETRWFDAETRGRLTAGRFWVEHDAERSGTGEMQRDLRENRFGATAWAALDPAARGFIASAERVFREHRLDAAFNLATVVIDLANAMEVQVNALLREAMQGSPDAIRFENIEGRSVDLAREGPISLGQLARVIGGNRARGEHLRARLEHGDWFVASLPPILEELAGMRNPAAHGGVVQRDDVVRLRGQMIGVGSEGRLLRLAMVRNK
ncbi:MAG: hypothetical protein JNL44_13425 [Gemmatimonadetes bacterium]|nr:hypothetical protein [Gemmatimonadota bacterium]